MSVMLFVVLGIIVGISLYDYITSNSWQAVTASDRVETVFENRNKNYGAYKIRRNYNLLIILITLSMGGAIAASYGISRIFVKPVVQEKKKETIVDMSTFTEDEKKEEKELEPLEEKVPEEQKTLAFVPPVIVDKQSDDEPVDQSEVQNANVDTHTQDGNDLGDPGDATPPPPPPPPPPPAILDVVEEPAEFPGGRDALVAYLTKNIKVPPVAEELGVKGKVYLKFVVSETGNISNVKVQRGIPDCKECDEEAKRVVEKMPDWKPGRNNGKAVNQWYTLPIVFNVQ